MRSLLVAIGLLLALPSWSQAPSAADALPPPSMATPPVPEPAPSALDELQPLDDGHHALDPWERVNRPIFALNNTLDRVILRPVAVVYSRATPKLAQRGVGNFFTNLQQPITSLNLLLQGHPVKFAGSLGRFVLNSTLGVAGIFDPATEAGIPAYDQDFGQTLYRWGWKRSRYVMLPLFGPATIRDGVGKGINTTVSPITWLAESQGAEYSLLYGVSARARGLQADAFLRGGGDEYLLMREAFLQYRRCQLIDCSDELPDYLLPDVEIELPDVDALRLRD